MAADSYDKTAFLFLRLLAFVYLVAIVSFWTQIDGLIGSHGISPVADMMEAVRQHPEVDAFHKIPTLCLLSASDTSLHIQCAAGTAFAIVGMCGIAPMFTFAGLWLIYLSLCVAGQTFMSFQWDALLLEAGFLAIFLFPIPDLSRAKSPSRQGRLASFCFAPLRLCASNSSSVPSRLGIFCLRLLLFKLMFGSGLVKVASGDPSWWPDLTALTYHYETTCLPIWTAWYAAKLPLWFQQCSCLVMLFLEFGVPFLFFTTRRLRCVAFVLEVFLQLVIATTGNYAFFNLLTIVLCVPLLDDGVWGIRGTDGRGGTRPSRMDSPADGGTASTPSARASAIRKFAITWPIYGLYATLSIMLLIGQFDRMLGRYGHAVILPGPPPSSALSDAIAPFRTVNSYGLFANMTKSRPEIIVEGSDDGVTWKSYEFKWKVGDPMRRPGLVAPHQPRLDWQMWFAALGDMQNTRWFAPFLIRLLEGSPSVLALLETNPFPDHPPHYIRANVYDYHFSDVTTRRETGAWWTRTLVGVYCPPGALP